jgi:hypothetical protein
MAKTLTIPEKSLLGIIDELLVWKKEIQRVKLSRGQFKVFERIIKKLEKYPTENSDIPINRHEKTYRGVELYR